MSFIFRCCFSNDLKEEIHTVCKNIEVDEKNLWYEKVYFTNELVEKTESRGLTIFRNKRKTHRYKPY
jgi:hypothetical protein